MNSLMTGFHAAAKYLDPAIKDAHANGVSAQDLLTALLMSAVLALRSINGDSVADRKVAFLNIAQMIFDTMEAATKPQA